jgi:hypothetical protein
MSLTGSIYKVTKEDLKIFINNNFRSLDSLIASADLSYFAIDFLEILSKYSGFDRSLIGKILQGDSSFAPDDGFIGYSTPEEVIAIKIEILDKITSEKFIEYLKKGEIENNPHSSAQNRDFLVSYFENIKKTYEAAATENMALIFKIG